MVNPDFSTVSLRRRITVAFLNGAPVSCLATVPATVHFALFKAFAGSVGCDPCARACQLRSIGKQAIGMILMSAPSAVSTHGIIERRLQRRLACLPTAVQRHGREFIPRNLKKKGPPSLLG